MDKELIEKYKADLLRMQRASAQPPKTPPSNTPAQQSQPSFNTTESDTGKLIAVITTLGYIYPLKNAVVTVFSGDYQNMNIIDQKITDQSGKTETFFLETPARALSLSAGAESEPFARYNMMVEAEGYVSNIHLNIPVFSGVTSLQRSDMMLLETAGENKGPKIFDEAQRYGLE